MKLVRYGVAGHERPGVFIGEDIFDASILAADYDETFFANEGLERLKKAADEGLLKKVGADIRLGPPIARPSKLICVGLNYRDHAAETNAKIPAEPILFFKSTTAIVGPNDDLILPMDSVKTDWEVELAVVIGRQASYVKQSEAEEYIAGYMLHNDYSEREFQLECGGQWVKGKSCDTFAPLGPFMATRDEIPDPDNLRLWLTVNDKLVQDGNTSDMIFGIPYLISYISRFMTLLPGDVITTGTPAGVGLGQKPEPWYLKEGDTVALGIDGLGSSRQHVKPFKKKI